MIFCDAPPLILYLHGDLALTTRSLPSLLAVPLYLGICLVLCVRRRTIGWIDPALVVGLTALQLLILTGMGMASPGARGLPGWALLAPFMLFLAGYGGWRLAGGRPLARWPWPRFGLLATMTVLLTDVGVALLTPAAPGKVWQLGGACLKDALLIGPPFLMLVHYWILDCRSSLVFCNRRCVDIGRCRFGYDGKAGGCGSEFSGTGECSDSSSTITK